MKQVYNIIDEKLHTNLLFDDFSNSVVEYILVDAHNRGFKYSYTQGVEGGKRDRLELYIFTRIPHTYVRILERTYNLKFTFYKVRDSLFWKWNSENFKLQIIILNYWEF